MNINKQKLDVIAAIIKLDDATLLSKLESILAIDEPKPTNRRSIMDFAGILTEEAGDAMMKAIHDSEGCGHPDCHFKKLH